MTIASRVYDATNYTEVQIAEMFQSFMTDGYLSGLAVSAVIPAAMTVSVALGRAHIQGYWYNSTAANVLTLAASEANPRIDRIILRLEVGTTNQIIARVLKGTAAGSPTAPALTQTASVWEISLAQVLVGSGVTSIVAGNITDERGSTTTCGLASVRKALYTEIIPTAAININSHKVVNLAAPTAAGDAARKVYFDGVLSGGVFGVTKCEILPWPSTSVPGGWLECNGQSVLRATYPLLFAQIGVTFGSADGTHFSLPDLRGLNAYGAVAALGTTGGEKTHTLTDAEMPAHTHTVPLLAAPRTSTVGGSGADTKSTTTTASAGSGTAHQNLQPYTTMKFIVRAS